MTKEFGWPHCKEFFWNLIKADAYPDTNSNKWMNLMSVSSECDKFIDLGWVRAHIDDDRSHGLCDNSIFQEYRYYVTRDISLKGGVGLKIRKFFYDKFK